MDVSQEFSGLDLAEGKLLSFGFLREGDAYLYREAISDSLEIRLAYAQGKWDLSLYDLDFAELSSLSPLSPHVQEAYQGLLTRLKEHLGIIRFAYPQAAEVDAYFASRGIQGEHPFSEDAVSLVYRHPQNAKWIALLMRIPYARLEKGKEGDIEILNFKAEGCEDLWQEAGIYPAYHMNKRYWVTVSLDGRLPQGRLEELLARSEELVGPKSKGKK